MMYEGETDDQFIVKVADTMDEAIRLMEVGFDLHAELKDTSCRKRNRIMDNFKRHAQFKV